MIVRIPSNSYSREVEEGKVDMRAQRNKAPNIKKSYWVNVCEAIPLVCKSFKLKMIDHLLLGGEHARKISPGFSSPIRDEGEVTPDEKKEIVKASRDESSSDFERDSFEKLASESRLGYFLLPVACWIAVNTPKDLSLFEKRFRGDA